MMPKPHVTPMNVRVGLCGFSMSMKTYALHFPVVEVQNTFYEPRPETTLQKWRRITPATLDAKQEPGLFRDSPTSREPADGAAILTGSKDANVAMSPTAHAGGGAGDPCSHGLERAWHSARGSTPHEEAMWLVSASDRREAL
jgi:uncharacterized protein DUF72